MDILLDYFNDEFKMKEGDISKIAPFGRANVVINCDLPCSSINGELERKVEKFMNEHIVPPGIKAKWDKNSEGWYRSQKKQDHEFPRINKLFIGINFDI